MTALIRLLRGTTLYPAPYHADSLADAVQHEPPDGVYTVTNTYPGLRVLKFDAHLDRLADSARRLNLPLALDRAALRAGLRALLTEGGWPQARFRVTVTRADPDSLLLTAEPFSPPDPALIARGVRVVTAAGSARINAAAKTTAWMHDRRALTEAMPPGIYDTILMDEAGHLLEGLGANFYAIAGGQLYTAGAGVLYGISRQIVLDVAPAVLPVVTQALTRADLPRIDEAFISSSSRAVIPVVQIDGVTLGDGAPGPHTRAIRAAYLRWTEAHLEPL